MQKIRYLDLLKLEYLNVFIFMKYYRQKQSYNLLVKDAVKSNCNCTEKKTRYTPLHKDYR